MAIHALALALWFLCPPEVSGVTTDIAQWAYAHGLHRLVRP